MPEDEYDLAGFVVGAVDKSRLFDRMHMRAGDVVLYENDLPDNYSE